MTGKVSCSEEVEQEGDKERCEGDSRGGGLECEMTDAFVAEHHEAVEEQVNKGGRENDSLIQSQLVPSLREKPLTVPKCFATKNNDDQKLFGLNKALLSESRATVAAPVEPDFLRPENNGIMTPKADVTRTMKMAPICRPWLYVPSEATPQLVSTPEQSPCV